MCVCVWGGGGQLFACMRSEVEPGGGFGVNCLCHAGSGEGMRRMMRG